MKKIALTSILAILTLFMSSCREETKEEVKPMYTILEKATIPQFNADNAYQLIEKQVSFGPRDPGSDAHNKAKQFFADELKKYADEVTLQNFSYTGYENKKLELTNIIAKFNPSSTKRILFCAHWDSRPRAEQDEIAANKILPIPGANDGASGCGILIELARVLKQNKVDYGIDIVLFDGEDYGKEGDLENYCLGAKYFAANVPDGYRPKFGILLDLVGDKEAVFKKEGNSMRVIPDVVNMVWDIAAKHNATVFSNKEDKDIYDDHIPLNLAGLSTLDIIDADLVGAPVGSGKRDYWHTQRDDMSNIGKETLKQVGEVLTILVYSLKINY